jgi:curved DNA-binding protein CbpA
MNDQTYYEILGVSESASAEDVRVAYRKLVLKYHPDRSGNKNTTDQFVLINHAYQVLSDKDRRRDYDAIIALRRDRQRQSHIGSPHHTKNTSKDSTAHTRQTSIDLTSKVTQAASLFSKGQYDRAETLAKSIIKRDPKIAIAHAILGDIARLRQNMTAALKHYSYAIQLDPKNVIFAKRYEELLRQTNTGDPQGNVRIITRPSFTIWLLLLISPLMMFYVFAAREQPIFPNLPPVSSWTAGLLVMLFVNGVILGAALSISSIVDKWESLAKGSSGKLSPAAALGLVAFVNFWASVAIYILVGFAQKSFTYSISRAVTCVALIVLGYSFASYLSATIIWYQTFLWSGNIIYLGLLCGWTVSDAFR